MNLNKKRIIAIPGDFFSCGEYRIIQPYSKLSKIDHDELEFSLYDYEAKNDTTMESLYITLSKYDAVVFQRVFDERILMILAALKASGVKVYMDIDDDLLNVSQDSPAWPTWRKGGKALFTFLKALELVDCAHISTPELIEAYYGRAKNFEVFYNGLDVSDARYDLKNSRRSEMPEDKVVVMWTGSSTHMSSIEEVKHLFRPLFDARPNAVFALCSNKEFLDMFNIKEEQKVFIPPVKIDDYYAIPSMCDIAITPVKINKFNTSKSELKCLEHGIWNVPCVSTQIAPYERFNVLSDGANLIAKKNKGKEWVKHVSALIDNESLRRELGAKAKTAVENIYNVDKVNERRISFFERELLLK